MSNFKADSSTHITELKRIHGNTKTHRETNGKSENYVYGQAKQMLFIKLWI